MNEVTHLFKTEAAGTCADVLDFWLYECSLDEAPDAAQVAAWRAVFQARGGAFARLAAVCQSWLDTEAADV